MMKTANLQQLYPTVVRPREEQKVVEGKRQNKSMRAKPQQHLEESTLSDPAKIDTILTEFDLCTKYGPCAGVSRLNRWERAQTFGLQPPPAVRDILAQLPSEDSRLHSLWEGRL
mmetsp:Transcript_11202/g.19133  ORF Transcript_11202/g.19133 Transcript_11202/m.19133 type:complete len:114 (-) Transcript_11202:245-586(-)